jgi:hypothetical protein
MESEGLLPSSQDPATESNDSIPYPQNVVLGSILILYFYLRLGLQRFLFSSAVQIKLLYTCLTFPMRATYHT